MALKVRDLCLRALLLACCVTTSVQGMELDWLPAPYSFVAEGESLRNLLVSFGANYDVSVIVSDRVTDVVSGRFEHNDPQVLLQQLSSLYNLIWYYDGAVLYVFKSTETQSRLLKLDRVSENELVNALKQAGIWEPRFSWKTEKGGKIVYVSGPPRYLELVEQTAAALDQQHSLRSEKQGDSVVEIFPLKYATAVDRNIQYRDSTIEAPGVATILSRVLGGASIRTVGKTPVNASQDSATAPPLGGVVVQAEPSINAIIVRDSKERLPMYQRLIEVLDKPSARIEVALSIIDISAENMAELGVDWQLSVNAGAGKRVDIRTSTGSNTGPQSANLVSSLLDRRGLNHLLAQVNLLQRKGNAQVVSRPTLLTQENSQAIIDHSETYYVKVYGERVAELKSIDYGTMLRMVPRIIQRGEQAEINLSLHIEDGNQKPNSSGLNGIPTISRTVVDTIARVGHGQSLLIGGIYRDELNQSVSKIPLLGDIPWVGALFRNQSDVVRRSVRLFIIEPRLIDDNGSLAQYLAVSNNRDLRLLEADEYSNQSPSLKQKLNSAQCLAFEQAKSVQQQLSLQGQASTLVACHRGRKPGWRVRQGECEPDRDFCREAGTTRTSQ